MKPLYLEFCGINSFSENATVDFRRLLSGGLFGIFGDTGSGKSTVLDAIHLALYGKIERASGAMEDCINFRKDKAQVVFEFEITEEGERRAYRVRRERRRKSGAAKATLSLLDGEKEFPVAEGTKEVDEKLRAIVGLDYDDFKKCIALPQGEFAALVHSKPAERVALVSRLFDLEKYGEKLGYAIRRKTDEINGRLSELSARMQENGGGSVEMIESVATELSQTKARLSEAEERLSIAKKVREGLEKLSDEKSEYDSLTAKLKRAEELLPAYEKKKTDVGKAERAKRVKDRLTDLKTAKTEAANAERKVLEAQEQLEKAAQALQAQRSAFETENFDDRIQKATFTLARLQAAATDLQAQTQAEQKLNECLQKYKQIKDKCPEEDFAGGLQKIEETLSSLGGEQTYAEFLKNGFKDVLLSEAYGEFRADLRRLSERFPQTQAETQKLIEKYTLVQTGDKRSFDVASEKLAFDELQKRCKELKKQREELEKRRLAYEENEREKRRVIEDGTYWRERYNAFAETLKDLRELGTADQAEKALQALKAAKTAAETKIATAEKQSFEAKTAVEAGQTLLRSLTERVKTATAALQTAIKEEGFESAEEAETLLSSLGDLAEAKRKTEEFFTAYHATKERLQRFSKDKFTGFDENALEQAKAQEKLLDEERLALGSSLAVLEDRLKNLNLLREKYLTYQKEYDENAAKAKLWEQLKSLTAKNKFMEFIASEYLQEICVAASRTLLSLTGGRYFLRYDKEFKAGDNLNGGELRAVKTLSGGETFLVSLSLALSLSGEIFKKSLRPIEFFFLDEGFGTLDEKLIDTVMDVLGKLSRKFAVGVISHVEEMKRRIDNKVLVTGAKETEGSRLTLSVIA